MSNIYVTEPIPSGKVVLETSRGDIEVELFAKECPKACKNFIALALEGYYDNVIWHRYVPEFILQTGDPSGTGLGGESFYGEPFQDEIHSRLRFNRRGLLGMANASERHSNESQFFLTLAPTPELQGRHTMFGRINNNTIYNLLALTEGIGDMGADDRPLYPPKLRTIRVIENPFEGEIQLRVTREERLAMKRNRRDAESRKQERDREALSGQKKKKYVESIPYRCNTNQNKRNVSLLSFGEAEDVEEDETFRGPKSSHDLLKDDKRLKKETNKVEPPPRKSKTNISPETHTNQTKLDVDLEKDLSALRQKAERGKSSVSTEKIAELEASIRGLSKRPASEDATKKKTVAAEKERGRALLEKFRSQYQQQKKGKSSDDETAKLLQSFQKRMRRKEEDRKDTERVAPSEEELIPRELREYGDSEDDEIDWRSHRFDFGGKSVLEDQHEGSVSDERLHERIAHQFLFLGICDAGPERFYIIFSDSDGVWWKARSRKSP